MSKQKKEQKHIEWYWLLLIGVIGTIAGSVIGGAVGAMITVLLGYLFILFAIAGGIRAIIRRKRERK